MRSHSDFKSAIHRAKSKLPLLMVGLFLVFVEMTVTARAQKTHHFTSSELSRPVRDLSIHELAQRYGIVDAIEISRQLEEERDARRERERIRIAQQRDRELRGKDHRVGQDLNQTLSTIRQPLGSPRRLPATGKEVRRAGQGH